MSTRRSKPALRSKTVVGNAALLVAFEALSAMASEGSLPPGVGQWVLRGALIGNIILRFRTSEPVSLTADKHTDDEDLMNVAEMIATSLTYLDDPRGDRFKRPEILRLLNRSQEDMENLIDIADEGFLRSCKTYAVVAADDAIEFALPNDLRKVDTVEREYSPRPIPARIISFRDRHIGLSSFYPQTSGQGESPLVYISGNTLGVVRPTSAYTLRVWYSRKLPELLEPDGTSEIPSAYHELLILGAVKRGAQSEDTAFRFETDYNRMREEFSIFIEQRQRHEPRRVHCVSDSESYDW